MKYPTLREQQASREMIDTFRGYNHNLRIGDGEFFDMKNMTSNYYPVLSPREKRGVYALPDAPAGLIAKDTLCYVDGTDFVMDEYRIDMGLSVKEEECPKQLISMGAYVIIMPDRKYINTMDITDFGNIDASVVIRPSDKKCWLGIMNDTGTARYVEGTGILSHTFKITETCRYRVFVQNNFTDGTTLYANGSFIYEN